MWKYVKSLEYPVNIKKKDLKMAKYLVTQYGGANGELAAAFRYPTDSNGVPFTVSYFATTGDPIADLSEDMAAD